MMQHWLQSIHEQPMVSMNKSSKAVSRVNRLLTLSLQMHAFSHPNEHGSRRVVRYANTFRYTRWREGWQHVEPECKFWCTENDAIFWTLSLMRRKFFPLHKWKAVGWCRITDTACRAHWHPSTTTILTDCMYTTTMHNTTWADLTARDWIIKIVKCCCAHWFQQALSHWPEISRELCEKTVDTDLYHHTW